MKEQDFLKLMTQYATLQQGKWNTREVFEYRFELNRQDGLLACFCRLRGGLFIAGFAATSTEGLDLEHDPSWIAPRRLLEIATDPNFAKRA